MNERTARKVVLMRAIETADTKHEVLSEDDRLYASRSARELANWQAAEGKSEPSLHHFLQQRADLILKRLAERTPAFSSFLHRRPLMPMVAVLLPLLGFIAGAVLDRIGDPHRVDLLSVPLLLIIGWNLLVYLALIVWALIPSKRTGWASPQLLRRLAVGKNALPRKLPAPLAAGLAQYLTDWSMLSAKLAQLRFGRAVHMAAAAFALGAIASLYARGIVNQYAAGWESTFLDAEQVHTMLSVLFAPALAVFPLQGFSLADIQALRFVQEPSPAGGARWVHLYAATLLLLVVLPRIVLAVVSGVRAGRLARNFPLDLGQPYFRLLADRVGASGPAVLRVVPYSVTVDEARHRGLASVAAMVLGEQAQLMLRPSSPYGEDPKDSLRDARLDDAGVAITAVLFNLAATPERENHGAFLDYLVRSTPRGIAVLLDESSLVERGAAQPGFDTRLEERIALWRQFCNYHKAPATVVNLLQPEKYPLDLGSGLALSTAP
ncbi:DUF2868 domain-containing protein [Herbaspirillum sp. SJZ107]|uniref:DUF2868 domain-containing protein n=1 Tax=Herbaspirillum sp. SJZ107 TaxID=2572881 RepID=UPI00114FAEE4|nr:DUF2868 domain-containing protein [Herbaspirillum sp. SJZ107]TQK00141.1 uncharacterized protein DUF2868 [Herbaspirillum sp. SJZ107]